MHIARLLRNRIYLTTHAVMFRERLEETGNPLRSSGTEFPKRDEEMGLTIRINIMRTLLNVTNLLKCRDPSGHMGYFRHQLIRMIFCGIFSSFCPRE